MHYVAQKQHGLLWEIHGLLWTYKVSLWTYQIYLDSHSEGTNQITVLVTSMI